MNFGQFLKSLEDPEAIYLLVTDQDYLKDRVLEACLERVNEAARTFDWDLFDLATDNPADVVARLRMLPWMTPRRWSYLKNAEAGGAVLEDYLKDPAPRTVLVLESKRRVKGWPKLPMIEMEAGSSAVSWVQQRFRKEGFSLGPGAAEMLVELVGNDFLRLNSEVEKQILWRWESKKVTVDSVLGVVAEARERDAFELIDAIAKRQRDTALRILNRLHEGGMAPQQVIAFLYWSFRRLLVAQERLERREKFFDIVKSLKIWSFKNQERQIRSYRRPFLINTILRIRDADRLSKTTSIDPKKFLERVIIDTCRE